MFDHKVNKDQPYKYPLKVKPEIKSLKRRVSYYIYFRKSMLYTTKNFYNQYPVSHYKYSLLEIWLELREMKIKFNENHKERELKTLIYVVTKVKPNQVLSKE